MPISSLVSFSAVGRAAIVATSALFALGCSGALDVTSEGALDEATGEDVATTTEALSSSTLVGKVVAYASPAGLNWSPKQTFGAGSFLANAGELSGVGNDATRLLELGPAMAVHACNDEFVRFANCARFENTTGANRTFPVAAGVSRLDVRPLVVAYRDANFGGIAEAFEVGRYEVANYDLGIVGNDTISSLRIAPGLTVRICSDDPDRTVGYTCRTYSSSIAQLPSDIDNRTSWMEVRPATVLYRDQSLSGVSQQLGPGRFPVSSLSVVGNDTVSSIAVSEGVQSRLCSDDPNATVGYTCGTFTKSALTLASNLDNRTSWVENRHAVILAPRNEGWAGGPTTLIGYATSPTDGELPDAGLRWYSSRDGFLGTGRKLTVNLTQASGCDGAGVEHIITLIATDSRGVTFSTQRYAFSTVIC